MLFHIIATIHTETKAPTVNEAKIFFNKKSLLRFLAVSFWTRERDIQDKVDVSAKRLRLASLRKMV